MQRIFFEPVSELNYDLEHYVNGYMPLSEVLEYYQPVIVISKIRSAYCDNLQRYKNSDGSNRIAKKLTVDCINSTLEELEDKFPVNEYPELWL